MTSHAEQTGGAAPVAEQEPDPVIEAYKPGIDRTLIRHNLRLTVQQRIDQMIDHLRALEEFRRAGRELHGK